MPLPDFDNHDDRIEYYELMLEADITGMMEIPLPEGYSYAFYQDGDRDAWIEIEKSAKEFSSYDEGMKAWKRYYEEHAGELYDRMVFVENPAGEKVATATAFYDIRGIDKSGDGWLHWVAVKREEQGKGLSKPMISHVIQIMKRLGYSRAKIPTQTSTWLAVKVYLDLGFRPIEKNFIRNRDGWRIVKRLTDHPALTELTPASDEDVIRIDWAGIAGRLIGLLDSLGMTWERNGKESFLIKNNGGAEIEIRLEDDPVFDEITLLFGSWHAHYIANENLREAYESAKHDLLSLLYGDAFVYSLTCGGEWCRSSIAGVSSSLKDAVIRDVWECAEEKLRNALLKSSAQAQCEFWDSSQNCVLSLEPRDWRQPAMTIDILTIFPEMFDSVLNASILGRARQQGLIEIECTDIRPFSASKHKNTDDYPFGGGAGMLMMAQPIADCMRAVCEKRGVPCLSNLEPHGEAPVKRIYLSPRGVPMTQKLAQSLASEKHLILLCGHYEGVDQRALDKYIDLEISIGDYVLTGGELGAMVIADCVARLIPGVLGSEESSQDESFSDAGLLEYPQYTRPRVFENMEVPEVLLNGDHAKIAAWRREQAILTTAKRRPALLENAALSEKERRLAESALQE